VVAAVYFIVPTTPVSKLLLYNGVGLSSVIAVLVGIRRNRPADPVPWRFIVAGQCSFLVADIIYYVLEAVMNTTPFPSPADAFYLGMYPLVILGLVRLVRQIAPGRDLASLVDALLVAVATFAVLGILVMDTYVTAEGLTLPGRIISLAYPVMDVALLAVAARLAVSVHLKHPSFALLASGLASLLIADTIYGLLNSAGAFETGGPADAFWLGFYVLIGAAALHPAMGTAYRPVAVREGHISSPRLFMLCLATLAVPVIDLLWGEPFDKILTVGTSMAMFLLVLSRLMGLMRVVRAREEKARYDATHDSLTGLANRAYFADHLTHVAKEREGGVVSVLFVDLDDFKTVNDSLGHDAGDQLLITVSERLAGCVRDGDLVARLSGDEFAVLLATGVDRQDAVAVAQRIQEALGRPVTVGEREVLISASIGIAIEALERGRPTDTLIRSADTAMYRAKAKGKGRFEFFELSMQTEIVDRLELRNDLQRALERDEFEVYYQPIVDLQDRSLVSVEALIRWRHPDRGLVGPDKFIPIAEQTGLIVPLGSWVLRQACTQVEQWRRQYPERAPKGVSVNLSVRQMLDPRLLETVADALVESGLEPAALTLEITESMLIEESDRGLRILEQLKAMRVKVAIDDFGTGYSSLSYLRRFPVDTIKIDRSFVRDMGVNPTSEALVRTVIDLAHVLNLTTVAEGVEELQQCTTLSGLQCRFGQGYLFAKPIPASDLEQTLLPPPVPEAAPARSRTAPLELEIVEGGWALDELTGHLDELHRATNVPLMARTRWLQAWRHVYQEHEPWAVVVRAKGTDRIEAAALLAHRHVDGLREVVGMGHGWCSCTRLPVRDARAARQLARGIVDVLQRGGHDWTLQLEQLPASDTVGRLLAQQLPNAELAPDLWVPGVDLTTSDSLDGLLSKNMRRQLRKAHNRVEADGVAMTVEFVSDEQAVEALLPDLERIHVARDHDAGRESDLDDPYARALWRRIVLLHAATGEVEVSTLRFDGTIVAFVIGLLDGASYRVFDGHFDSTFARYSPGRIIESAVLGRALTHGRFTELDWMAGVASEKILASNTSQGRMRLTAARQTAEAVDDLDTVGTVDQDDALV
jgi:diguanylate cyclase (GGDEF)-like protein